jgi:hypothetical protein
VTALDALESLVEKWRRLGAMPVGETAPNPMFTKHADELEPIIQQLRAERERDAPLIQAVEQYVLESGDDWTRESAWADVAAAVRERGRG